MLEVTTRPFGEPWVVQELGLVRGNPLLLLLLVSYSAAPAWALPLVPALALSLPFQCSLPFPKHVSMEAPCTYLVGPVLGSVLSGTKPGVSRTGQPLTRQSNDIFPQACHHALSVTCFSSLPSSGVTFTLSENYLLFSPCMICQVLVR